MTDALDRLSIRELIEAYADAVFRRDAEAWIDCWADDATWDLMGHSVAGRDAILATWKGAMSAFETTAFFAQPGRIAVEGDLAAARVWTQEVLVTKAGDTRRVVGAYDDSLVRRDGRWLFARRAFRIVHDG